MDQKKAVFLKIRSRLFLLIIVISLIAGCGGGGGNSEKEATPDPSPAPTEPVTPPEQEPGKPVAVRTIESYTGNSEVDKLIKTSCDTAGGTAIYLGIDVNADGILQESEYFKSYPNNPNPKIVCNGSSGSSGNDGLNSLVKTSPVAHGDARCPGGGVRIDHGLDQNRNGSLDFAEVTGSDYVCAPLAPSDDPEATKPLTQTSTLKGALPGSRAARSAQDLSETRTAQAVATTQGGLWLCPEKILATIEADIAQIPDTVPPPFTKPLEIPVNPDGSFEIRDVPSGADYSLVYVTGDGTGTKVGDIRLAPGQEKAIMIAAPKPLGSVRLKVKSLSGQELEGASIRLHALDRQTTYSSSGDTGFDGLPEGNYALTVEKEGYVSRYMSFKVDSGKTTDLQTLELNSERGELRGSVQVAGLENHANVVVYAQALDGSLYTALTDAQGRYVFPALPVGDGYSVLATAHDFATSKVDNIRILSGQTSTAVAMTLRRNPPTSGSIEGFARFEGVKEELQHAGIIVSVEGTDYEAITARDGSFVLNRIPAGNYTVNFTDSNHKTHTMQVVVVAGASTRLLEVSLLPRVGTVKGKVVDDEGSAVANATVQVQAARQTATIQTGEDGTFTLTGVLAGSHRLEVIRDGHMRVFRDVVVAENKTTTLPENIQVPRLLLTGRASLGDAIKEHDGITVTVDGTGIYTVTDKDGKFTLRGVPPGVQVLMFQKPGFVPLPLRIDVPANAPLNLTTPQVLRSAAIANASLVINEGQPFTNNRKVTLRMQADNARYVDLSESSVFDNVIRKDYAIYGEYTFSSSGDEGNRILYARFVDSSGSPSSGNVAVASASIVYDTSAPVLQRIRMGSEGHLVTNHLDAVFHVEAYDPKVGGYGEPSGLAFLELRNQGETDFQRFPWQENAYIWTLTPGPDGNRSFDIRVVDRAGNRSHVFSAAVTYDTTAPVFTSVRPRNLELKEDRYFVRLENRTLLLEIDGEGASCVELALFPDFEGAKREPLTGSPVSFLLEGEDGAKTLYARLCDDAGNVSSVLRLELVLDTTPPTQGLFAPHPAQTRENQVTLILQTPVVDAHLSHYEAKGGLATFWEERELTDTLTWTLLANSPNTLELRGVDKAGNRGDSAQALITHDKMPPTTVADPGAGSYRQPQRISLVTGEEGVKSFYTLDGTLPGVSSAQYTSPILLATEGLHSLRFLSVDEAGNQEETQVLEYVIDSSPPKIRFNLNEPSYTAHQNLRLEIEDFSPVDVYYSARCSLKGDEAPDPETEGRWYSQGSDIPLNQDGIWKLRFYARDTLGHETKDIRATYRVDSAPPVLAVNHPSGGYSAGTKLDILLTATDAQDKNPAIYFTTDGSTPTAASQKATGTATVSFNTLGTHTLKAFSLDDLGNSSGVQEYTYVLSTTIEGASAEIHQKTTWTKSASPYRILSNIVIAEGGSLAIEPGTVLLFAQDTGMEISGTLMARGTLSDPVQMRNLNEGEFWSGLYFHDGSQDVVFVDGLYSEGSILEHTVLENTNRNYSWQSAAITLSQSAPFLSNLTLKNSFGSGIHLNYVTDVIPRISHVRMEAIGHFGVLVSGSKGQFTDMTILPPADTDDVQRAAFHVQYGSDISVHRSMFEGYSPDTALILSLDDNPDNNVDFNQNYFGTTDYAAMKALVLDPQKKSTWVPALSGHPDTADFDGDGVLDILDPDTDGDGYTDEDEWNNDTSPFDKNDKPVDTDGDLIGDKSDPDMDGDGYLNADETGAGTDPYDPLSYPDLIPGGHLAQDTVWPLREGATVYVKSNVIIPEGITLTIRPGTLIRFAGNPDQGIVCGIEVRGALYVEGEEGKTTRMEPRVDMPKARWGGITYAATAQGAVYDGAGNYLSGPALQHLEIRLTSGPGIQAVLSAGDAGKRPMPWLSHVRIVQPGTHGLHLDSVAGLRTDSLEIDYPDSTTPLTNAGIFARNSQFTTRNSRILRAGYGLDLYGSSLWEGHGDVISQTRAIGDTHYNIAASVRLNEGAEAVLEALEIRASRSRGIYAGDNSGLVLRRSRIEDTQAEGLFVRNTRKVLRFEENEIQNSLTDGIRLEEVQYAFLKNNVLKGHQGWGLKLASQFDTALPYGLRVEGNRIQENRQGVFCATPAVLEYNTITANLEKGFHLESLKVSEKETALAHLRFNNIYANGVKETAPVQDNGHYNLFHNRTEDWALYHNYLGSFDRTVLDTYAWDKVDDLNLGAILYGSYLKHPVEIDERRVGNEEQGDIAGSLPPGEENTLTGALFEDHEVAENTSLKTLYLFGGTLKGRTGQEVLDLEETGQIRLYGGTVENLVLRGRENRSEALIHVGGSGGLCRNLNLSLGRVGIRVESGALLEIRDSEIHHHETGIEFLGNATVRMRGSRIHHGTTGILGYNNYNSNGTLDLQDSQIGDLTETAIRYIRILNMERSRLYRAGEGVKVYNNTPVNISDSEIVDMAGVGLQGGSGSRIRHTLIRNTDVAVSMYGSVSSPSLLEHLTLDANRVGVNNEGYTVTLRNSILTANAIITTGNSIIRSHNVYYANLEVPETPGTGEILAESSPYRALLLGNSTEAASTEEGHTVLKDSFLQLHPHTLEGAWIQPDVRSSLRFRVLGNTETSITLEGEIPEASRASATSYTLTDYRTLTDHAAAQASSTVPPGPVGAFTPESAPVWDYAVYSDAQPTREGTVKGYELWSGTVMLEGNLSIPQGSSVRVQRGSAIRMAPTTGTEKFGLDLGWHRAMVVEAGPEPLTFASSSPTPAKGDWKGIHCGSGFYPYSRLEIRHAETGIRQDVSSDFILELRDSLLEENKTALAGYGRRILHQVTMRANDTGVSNQGALEMYASSIRQGTTGISGGTVSLYDSQIGELGGTAIDNVDSLHMERSRLYRAETGIYNNGGSTINISDSEIVDMRDLGLRGGSGSRVRHTLIRNTDVAVSMYGSVSSPSLLEHLTLDANRVGVSSSGNVELKNSILTGNAVPVQGEISRSHNVYYANLEVPETPGTGEIFAQSSPYRALLLGSSTEAASTGEGRTVLKDSFLQLHPHTLEGAWIQPDVRSPLRFRVLGNTETSITLEGEIPEASRASATSYTLTDYRTLTDHAAAQASSTVPPGPVGAFTPESAPVWDYAVYSDAQPTREGTVKGYELWSGTVMLQGNLSIPQGSSVRVQRGSVIRMAPTPATEKHGLYLGWHRAMVVEAGPEPLTFASSAENPAKGDWEGIRCGSGFYPYTRLEIRHAETGIKQGAPYDDYILELRDSLLEENKTALEGYADNYPSGRWILRQVTMRANDTGVSNAGTLEMYGSSIRQGTTGISGGTVSLYDGRIGNLTGSAISDVSTLHMERSRLHNAGNGIYTSSYYANYVIRASEIAEMSGFGVYMAAYYPQNLSMSHTLIRHTNVAVSAAHNPNDVVRLNQLTLDTNGVAVVHEAGTLTLDNSILSNNGMALSGSITPQHTLYYANLGGVQGTQAEEEPYASRYSGNFHVRDGHMAKTASSTGGELGIYGGDSPGFAWLSDTVDNTLTADRTLAGPLTRNEYWDGENILLGDLVVERGRILRIAEGTVIRVPEGNRILVRGRLELETGAETPLIMTAAGNAPLPGAWEGLYLEAPQRLRHLKISHARTGILAEEGAANLYLEHVEVRDVSEAGMNLAKGSGHWVRSGRVLRSGGSGIRIGANSRVEDSTVYETAEQGLVLTGEATARRNFIARNGAEGIRVETDQSVSLHHNLILDAKTGIRVSAERARTRAEYNTLSRLEDYALDFTPHAENRNSARFNLITEMTGTETVAAIRGASSLEAEGNGFWNIRNNAWYADDTGHGGLRRVADLEDTDPRFLDAVALNIGAEPLAGIYALTGLNYRLAADSPFLHHSPYGAQTGAYNQVMDIITHNPLIPANRMHDLSFVNKGMDLFFTLRLASTVAGKEALAPDFGDLDPDFDPELVRIEDLSRLGELPEFCVSYALSETLTLVDGAGKKLGLTVTPSSPGAKPETLDFPAWRLDNTPPVLTLSGIGNGDVIRKPVVVKASLKDAGIGGHDFLFSRDGGQTWQAGDTFIELGSGGVNDGNAAFVRMDGKNVLPNGIGLNLVSLNPETFAALEDTARVFATDALDAAVTYLNSLPEDTLIAMAVKGNGRSANTAQNTALNRALLDFGFSTDWGVNHSFLAVGYKGPRKMYSFSDSRAPGEGQPLVRNLSRLATPMLNARIRLDVDTPGEQALHVRAVDFLGNESASEIINYTVGE